MFHLGFVFGGALGAVTMSNLGTYIAPSATSSFSASVNLTPTGSNRLIVVLATSEDNSPANLTSCTIGGESTTVVAGAIILDGGARSTRIYSLRDDDLTGINTITVNGNGSLSDIAFTVLALYNIEQEAARDTATDESGALSQSIDKFIDGITVGVAVESNDARTFSWTNLTELVDSDVGDYRHSVAYQLTTSNATETVTATTTGTIKAMALASWR